jgi:hypothetical protein
MDGDKERIQRGTQADPARLDIRLFDGPELDGAAAASGQRQAAEASSLACREHRLGDVEDLVGPREGLSVNADLSITSHCASDQLDGVRQIEPHSRFIDENRSTVLRAKEGEVGRRPREMPRKHD